MKKLLLFVTIIVTTCYNVSAQNIKLKLSTDSTTQDIQGGVINKGSEFLVNVLANGNGNTTARSLYFDFEFQNTAFDLVSVTHTGTGGNGGILPAGSSITLDKFSYPGYSWTAAANNTTANGNANYANARYSYTDGGPKTILRVYLNWASPNGMPYNNFDRLLVLKFRLKADAPGFNWDPIKMNFAAAFNQNGSTGATDMTIPLTTVIGLNPTASKYLTATIEPNGNIDNFTLHRVLFQEVGTTTAGYLVDATSTGALNIDQTRFKPDTEYRVMMMVNMDSMENLYSAAVTVSDYTTAQAEFVSQNLDGTFKNQSITTGAGYLAADVNRTKVFDGGDLTKIYSQTVGVDKLIALPAQYTPGTDSYMSVPTFTDSTYNALTPANWKDAANFVTFKTGAIGENRALKLKFLLYGDINRSHSSQVMIGGAIATNAVPSLKKNIAASKTMNIMINTPQFVPSIDVSLKNATVTSNTIEIPVTVNTGGKKLSALQFEFVYDPAKVKFEDIKNELPNTWYTFVDNKSGKIKFGALDRELKTPVTGELVPFKLRFSTIGQGVDINTMIKVTPNMDAASNTGYQLGINLNTDVIKLTGYNNF